MKILSNSKLLCFDVVGFEWSCLIPKKTTNWTIQKTLTKVASLRSWLFTESYIRAESRVDGQKCGRKCCTSKQLQPRPWKEFWSKDYVSVWGDTKGGLQLESILQELNAPTHQWHGLHFLHLWSSVIPEPNVLSRMIDKMKVNFTFYFQIKIPESGGRLERNGVYVYWDAQSFDRQRWFGVTCHLLLLVHCILPSPNSVQSQHFRPFPPSLCQESF